VLKAGARAMRSLARRFGVDLVRYQPPTAADEVVRIF
jgi:hypothetical protein